MDSRALMIVLTLIVLGVVAYLSYQYDKKRRQELKSWASRRGFSYQPDKVKGFCDRFPNLKILHRGHSRSARNIIEGHVRDRRLIAFDYKYTTGHGKHRSVHHMSVITIRSDFPLIPLFIRPEHVFDKVGEFVGLDDIDFESAEFSRTFYVKSPDKRWAYDVIHGRMMEYLLAQPRFHIQMDYEHLAVYRTRRFKTADFDAAIKLADGMFRRIPEFLVRQMTGVDSGKPDQEIPDQAIPEPKETREGLIPDTGLPIIDPPDGIL